MWSSRLCYALRPNLVIWVLLSFTLNYVHHRTPVPSSSYITHPLIPSFILSYLSFLFLQPYPHFVQNAVAAAAMAAMTVLGLVIFAGAADRSGVVRSAISQP